MTKIVVNDSGLVTLADLKQLILEQDDRLDAIEHRLDTILEHLVTPVQTSEKPELTEEDLKPETPDKRKKG